MKIITRSAEKTANVVGFESWSLNVEGFEGWSLAMIKDFIVCMDDTRKKFARCSKRINLVHLILDRWKELYPETEETVGTLLDKIKHLKEQKYLIKKLFELSIREP